MHMCYDHGTHHPFPNETWQQYLTISHFLVDAHMFAACITRTCLFMVANTHFLIDLGSGKVMVDACIFTACITR